ncbi:MAG: hypothetical protein ABF289_19665 [Clostridiales bacterium]
MLKYWQSHEDYKKRFICTVLLFINLDPSRLKEFNDAMSKLFLLNLDKVLEFYATLNLELDIKTSFT